MFSVQCSLSEKQIKARLRKIIFQSSRTKCPYCANLKIKKINNRYWCKRCRKFFSLTSTTWLKGMKFGWKRFLLLLHCWLKSYSVNTTRDLTKLSRPTIYDWYSRFRQNIPQFEAKLSEEVEIDESWFGPRNKGRRGHTWKENKVPVIGIYARQSDLLIAEQLPEGTAEYIIPFVRKYIDPITAHIFSDKYRPYKPLTRLGLNHTAVDHYLGQYTETNRIEGMWSVMKRYLKRTYYAVSREKFPEYVCEITYRINTRRNPDSCFIFLEKTIKSAA